MAVLLTRPSGPIQALVAGMNSCPCKVTGAGGKEKIAKGSEMETSVKVYNSSHLRPTRSLQELIKAEGDISQQVQGPLEEDNRSCVLQWESERQKVPAEEEDGEEASRDATQSLAEKWNKCQGVCEQRQPNCDERSWARRALMRPHFRRVRHCRKKEVMLDRFSVNSDPAAEWQRKGAPEGALPVSQVRVLTAAQSSAAAGSMV
ncbi:60S ribosomal protein L27 [Heterocephalus glaber]|uniref:60S ribosomal protein L27 n=1 Tax=Heterocephalus glaber TaxID=10181 RepID=G5BJA8_HETGA|nr:60S ribosomal protein L27 [Heterocephalus glaber]